MPDFLTIVLALSTLTLLCISVALYRKRTLPMKGVSGGMEEELLKSKRSYENLTEISPVGIFRTDASGHTTYVNPRWCQITGLPNGKALGNGWLDAVHPDDRDSVFEGWKKAIVEQTFSVCEYRFIRSDGRIAWVLGQAVPERGIHGEITGYVGTTTDVTDQVVAKNAIINERNLSDTIINSLPGIFYLYTDAGQFLRWNGSFEEVTGYSPDEIRRMHPLDFFDTDEKELLRQKIGNVFIVGEDHVQANFLLKTGAKIPYYFTGKAITYEGKRCLLGVGIDFSDRIQAQETIKETTEQLRQLAAHLQNIREEERLGIARDIHDDLGQQLTAVKMAIARLSRQTVDDPERAQNFKMVMDMISKGIDSLRRISTDLRPGILDDLGLVETMKWQIEEFEKRFSISVSAGLPENPDIISPVISINLFRIFQETLTNIARHAEATAIEVTLHTDNRHLYLKVRDNGKGFNAGEIRSKRTLGLLGMKERTLMIGGQFTMESQPGLGTTIEIEIPYDKPDAVPNPPG